MILKVIFRRAVELDRMEKNCVWHSVCVVKALSWEEDAKFDFSSSCMLSENMQ